MTAKSDNFNFFNVTHWIESFEFTRSKRSTIEKDFSDATMVAEIIKYYWPDIIDLHNYTPTTYLSSKIANWETLNIKVLKKLKLHLSKDTIKKLSTAANRDTVYQLLTALKKLIDKREYEKQIQQNNSNYIIHNYDMIEISKTDFHEKESLSREVVNLINKLKQEIVEKESKIEHKDLLLQVKNSRIEDLEFQLNQMKEDLKRHR